MGRGHSSIHSLVGPSSHPFHSFRKHLGDFPGGPVDKTPLSQCRGPGFHVWSGSEIPYACNGKQADPQRRRKIPPATIKARRSQRKNKSLSEKVKVFVAVLSDSLPPHKLSARLLSMGFSRQDHWSGLSCPPPGHLPVPGIEPTSPALQAGS